MRSYLPALAWAAFLLSQFNASSQENTSVSKPSKFGITLQLNNYASQAAFIDEFYYKTAWSADANAKKQNEKINSYGLSLEYIFKKSVLLRINGYTGFRSCIANMDSVQNVSYTNFYSTDHWMADQKHYGLSFGMGRVLDVDHLHLKTGISLNLLGIGEFSTFHYSRTVWNDPSNIGAGTFQEYTSRTILRREVAFGPGTFAEFDLDISKGLKIGGEFTWEYLYAHLKDNNALQTTHYVGYYNGDPSIIYDVKMFRPSSIGAALNVAYFF